MNTFECIETRRSCRRFKDQPLEREKLDRIIAAGRFAPCGSNSQTTHFIAITSREVLNELADPVREELGKMEITEGMYRSMAGAIRKCRVGPFVFHYNAPVLIVVANKKTYSNAMADSACSLENMMLEANELDLGSCWINHLHWLDENPAVRAYLLRLGLGEDETVCGSVSVGYAEVLNREPAGRAGKPGTSVR
jgi:nitroreductase